MADILPHRTSLPPTTSLADVVTDLATVRGEGEGRCSDGMEPDDTAMKTGLGGVMGKQQEDSAASDNIQTSLKSRTYMWCVAVLVTYVLLILSFAGVLYAVVQLSNKAVISEDKIQLSSPDGTESYMGFSPLPLLWAVPLELYQRVPSVVLQLSESERQLFMVKSVLRDTSMNVTRLSLATDDSLFVSPDIGLLLSPSGDMLARWNFNTLWREEYINYTNTHKHNTTQHEEDQGGVQQETADGKDGGREG
eukprot:GHVQ01042039.1.p1 GENE.GHVQ01042039.1~~GHVQ01042039.1.p1  ORF type:complete len:287 (+),score=64.87 GHVQ01042039.1:112-861(+)